MKKIFALVLSVFIVLGSSVSVSAAPSSLQQFLTNIDTTMQNLTSLPNTWYNTSPIGIALKYFTKDSSGSSSGGSSSSSPMIINNNTVEIPRPFYDNSQVYNSYTNNYETINNSYYSTYNDYYIYETDNYFISYDFEYNFYSICVAPISSPTQGKYFKVYFELPDGRSSFNLKPEDIRGIVFNYDVINYDRVITDSDTVALYHLDGTNINSVSNNYPINISSNFSFVDGYFNGAVQQVSGFTGGSGFDFSLQGLSEWTVDFWVYFSEVNPITFINFNGDQFHVINVVPDEFIRGGWSHVVCCSDGYFSINSNGTFIDSNSPLISDLSVDLFNRGFHSTPYGRFTIQAFASGMPSITVGNDTYNSYFNIYSVYDEIRLTSGVHHDIITRYEPYDLNFAYVIPSFDKFANYTPISSLPSPLSFDEVVSVKLLGIEYSDNRTGITLYALPNSVGTSFSTRLWVYLPGNPNYGRDGYFSANIGDILEIRPVNVDSKLYFDVFNVTQNTTSFVYSGNNLTGSFVPTTFRSNNYYTFLSKFVDVPSNLIAIQSPYIVRDTQIGGVRKFNPNVGDVYISLFDDVASSVQQYFDGVWNTVSGAVYLNGKWNDLLKFNFTSMMLVSESDNAITNPTYIINNNYYGSDGSGVDVTVSGNDISITVDTSSADPDSFLDFLAFIPLFFGYVGTIIGVCLPFLPVWLSVLITTSLGLVVTLIILVFVRRK